MNNIIISVIITLSCILNSSCSKESESKIIETELQSYFDTFVLEASLYNLEIDLSSIDIGAYVKNIETNGTVGQCITYSDGSKDIVIDVNNWDKINDEEKEYIVFHELGHCILERSHINEEDENGFCTSIMQSGEGICLNRYDSANRDQLLEELFTH